MIFVDRFHQHKGIGRLLLEKLFEISKEHGMLYGRLTVDDIDDILAKYE